MRRGHSRRSGLTRGLAVVAMVMLAVGLAPVPPSSGQLVSGRPAPARTTHQDVAPPGVDLRRVPTTAELRERITGRPDAQAQALAALAVSCEGDGVSGNRVQLIYAHAANTPNRYFAVRDLLQRVAANADDAVNYSAAAHGVGRRIRFTTSGACRPTVEAVTLSRSGDDSFDATVRELATKGYRAADRKYLVFMDGNGATGEKICGLGEVYADAVPGQDNANNIGPSYARVDSPCWGYSESIELHEIVHMLGAVQGGAPHHTRLAHCTDEADRMCYPDEPGVTMTQECPADDEPLLDCGDDDYFNPSPAPGSYLAQHWNTADSSFLAADEAPPVKPAVDITVPETLVPGGPVRVQARVSLPEGRTARLVWSSTLRGCGFAAPAAADTTFWCPAGTSGWGRVSATVTDSLGLTATTAASFFTVDPPRPRRATFRTGSRGRVARTGDVISVEATLLDLPTGRPVIGVPAALYERRWGARSWQRVASSTTSASGRVGVRVRVGGRATYQLVSTSTPGWAGAVTPEMHVWTRRPASR